MRPVHCVALLLVMFACVSTAVAQAVATEPNINLRIRKVRANLYMIDDVKGERSDAGGNVAAWVGDDGVVLIDSMMVDAAPEIPAVLKAVTAKPVRFVAITHPHPDHRGGVGFFSPNATVIAHSNAWKLASSAGSDGEPADARTSWPDLLVSDRLTLVRNDETIAIRHYPRAHTKADLVVFFRKANVVHLGDNYFSGMFPFVDSTGHIDGVIALMDDVLAQTNADTLFIPGHGPCPAVPILSPAWPCSGKRAHWLRTASSAAYRSSNWLMPTSPLALSPGRTATLALKTTSCNCMKC